jgi:Tat protein secretion system quality control protein TatD with DNase activity
MYDEDEYGNAESLDLEQKIAHYQSVLSPKSEDREFLQRLPDPRPFRHFLQQTKTYLERYPLALVGEIGLDRSFRIPEAWLPEQVEERDDALTPGGREGRKLSPYRVSIDHQKKVLLAQLRLAGELDRAVSVHGVQAHGIVYETLAESWKGHERKVFSKKERKRQESAVKANVEPVESDESETTSGPKPYPPRICLHSYSGPAETVKQYMASIVPAQIYFSFSTTINSWSEDGSGKVEAAVRAVPDDNMLVESDMHTAGEDMDRYLEAAIRKICEVKQWDLEAGVQQLGRNWRRFVFG